MQLWTYWAFQEKTQIGLLIFFPSKWWSDPIATININILLLKKQLYIHLITWSLHVLKLYVRC